MMSILKGGFLAGYKTYVVAVLGIISTLAGWALGDIAAMDAAKLVFDGVLAMTIRAGIAKV